MIIKKRKEYIIHNRLTVVCAITSVLFFGIMLAYSFATAWFFIAPAGEGDIWYPTFIFYRVGVPPLLTISLLAGVVGVATMLDRKTKKGVV